MWDRRTLKFNAKQELRQSYWLSFAVCLLAGILGGGASSGSSSGASSSISSGSSDAYSGFFDNPVFVGGLLITLILVFAFAICFSLFVSGPITVGKCGFFVRCVQGNREFGNLFSAFKKGYYMQTVKTMFLMSLYTFLWSLLFVIPGIIKSYEYRMIPYLISENPSLTTDQAFRMSREMTNGEKGKMFVLDLSFIGWYLLGTLALIIGVIFVTPYAEATNAQLYYALCAKMNSAYPPQPGYQPPYQGQPPVYPPRDNPPPPPPYQGPEF